MPAVAKFAILAAILSGIGYVALYVMAVHFEPTEKEVRKSIPSITLER